MFDSEELRKLATDERYSTVQIWSFELLSLLDEYERLRKLTTCGCGDSFTEHDPGTCGNCLAGMGRTAEVERLRDENEKLAQEMLTPEVFIRLVEWLKNPRPAAQVFTSGIERQIAYALEMDVLPEVKRLRSRLAHFDEPNFHGNR